MLGSESMDTYELPYISTPEVDALLMIDNVSAKDATEQHSTLPSATTTKEAAERDRASTSASTTKKVIERDSASTSASTSILPTVSVIRPSKQKSRTSRRRTQDSQYFAKAKEIQDNIDFCKWYLDYFETMQKKFNQSHEAAVKYEEDKQKDHPKKLCKFSMKPRKEKTTQKKTLSKLEGDELLTELKTYVITPPETLSVPIFDAKVMNEEKIKTILVDGKVQIAHNQSIVLKDYIHYGCWLNQLAIKCKGVFNTFVKDNLRFSLSWTKKIRKMGLLFQQYKLMQQLNISLTIAVSICSNLKTAISQANPEEKGIWLGL